VTSNFVQPGWLLPLSGRQGYPGSKLENTGIKTFLKISKHFRKKTVTKFSSDFCGRF